MLFLIPSKEPFPHLTIIHRIKNVDWIGAVLATTCLALFTLALSFGGNQFAWNSGVVIGFFVASGVLGILFMLSQTILPKYIPEEKRLFPAHYFLKKDMVLLSVATGAGTCGMFCAIYYVPLYFQFTRGDTAIMAAVRLLPLIVLAVFFTVGTGAALSMTGIYAPLYIFGGVCIIIGYSLLHTLTPTTSVSNVYGYLVLIGIGTGSFVQMGFAVAQAISPKHETEAAISFVSQGQLLGIIIGLAIAGSLFINGATNGLEQLFPDLSPSAVKAAIAGTDSGGFLESLSPELQAQALDVIVSSMDKVFILGITAGAVAFVCGCLLTHKRLDMKGAAAGMG